MKFSWQIRRYDYYEHMFLQYKNCYHLVRWVFFLFFFPQIPIVLILSQLPCSILCVAGFIHLTPFSGLLGIQGMAITSESHTMSPKILDNKIWIFPYSRLYFCFLDQVLNFLDLFIFFPFYLNLHFYYADKIQVEYYRRFFPMPYDFTCSF